VTRSERWRRVFVAGLVGLILGRLAALVLGVPHVVEVAMTVGGGALASLGWSQVLDRAERRPSSRRRPRT
jgi:hypothetical protein